MIRLSLRRITVGTGGLFIFGLMLYLYRSFDHQVTLISGLPVATAEERRLAIADAFQHAWDGYSSLCFGHDSVRPVSETCEDDFGGWGATAIDSLSTAILMGKKDVVRQILEFISTLDFTSVAEGSQIQVFEVTIRHFGGMLSAWDLLTGPFSSMAPDEALMEGLYRQMVELGDILSCAFATPSGVPRGWLNPTTCETDDGTMNSVAGVGTMILEFARLSAITGNDTYTKLAERAEEYLLYPTDNEPFPGLLGSFVSVSDGEIENSDGSWGAMSDSFYEYLLKAYMYSPTKYAHYLDRWSLAACSTIQHIGSHPHGHPEYTLLSPWSSTTLDRSMETLAWFAGGNLILGGMVTNNATLINYGLSIADAAGAVYALSVTGLGGEFVTWRTQCHEDEFGNEEEEEEVKEGEEQTPCDPPITITDGRYQLRPEVIETWYHAYRATRNRRYADWAWTAFLAINTHCRTDVGFSAIEDVNAVGGGAKADRQESFLFAEVFKYLYLIHVTDEKFPVHVQDSRRGRGNEWVFNTEAHPLRVAGVAV